MTDGYPVCRLGAVASVQGGFAFKSGDFTETGVPVLKIKNVRLREVDTTEPAYVDQSVAKDTARYFCKTGDLLISMTGSGPQAPNSVVGRVARFTGPSDRYLINQRVGRFVNKAPDKLDQRYLFYVLARHETLWKLVSVATGSANQANISGSQIESLEVPLPPLAEQKAIAAVLGALDDKIALNRRMNATLEAMARALFQSWFVDFDPVRAKLDGRKPAALDPATAALFPEHLEDSPLGHIPKGWKAGGIQDCCVQIQNGGTPRRNEPRFWDGGKIPWLASGEVRQSIITATNGFITEEGLAESSAKWVPAFSTVVALYGATAGQVSFISSRLTTNQAVCALIPKKDFAFFNYLTMRGVTSELENKAVGSAQQNISKGIVEETKVVLPPSVLVERFAEVAGPLFERWISNLHQSLNLATLRDTLLPKLLSGELSVESEH